MRRYVLLLALTAAVASLPAQQRILEKGKITENLALGDSVSRQLSVFLPSDFETSRKWPLLFVTTKEGDPLKPMEYLQEAAEKNGFLLATNAALLDSINLTKQVIFVAKSLDKLKEVLPLDLDRIFIGGIGRGGKLASIIPSMIPGIRGVLTLASGPPNGELVSSRDRFYYVSLLNRTDQNYIPMLQGEENLSSKDIPAHVLYFEKIGDSLPEQDLLNRGFALFDLMAMYSGRQVPDSAFIDAQYGQYVGETSRLFSKGHYLLAEDRVDEAIAIFEDLRAVDTLKAIRKQIRRTRGYRDERKIARTLSLRERLLREDFDFYLGEDLLNFNLNNLGWWRHQMGRIREYQKSWRHEEALMGFRLQSYLVALTNDYARMAVAEKPPDEDALILLNMLRTIILPEQPEAYLKVVSLTSKYGDYGTALFYAEELLKTGFDDKERLYGLEHTALLRITPEFNALIEKYLSDPRYEIPEVPDRGF